MSKWLTEGAIRNRFLKEYEASKGETHMILGALYWKIFEGDINEDLKRYGKSWAGSRLGKEHVKERLVGMEIGEKLKLDGGQEIRNSWAMQASVLKKWYGVEYRLRKAWTKKGLERYRAVHGHDPKDINDFTVERTR